MFVFLMIKGYFIEIQFSNNHINDTPHQCSEHVLTLTGDANGEYTFAFFFTHWQWKGRSSHIKVRLLIS